MAQPKSANLSIKKPLAPVYLLFGTQDFLIQLMKKNLTSEALVEEERDFNLSRYDLTELPLEHAIEDAETIPFFGEKKVVIMDNAFFLTGERTKTKVEQTIDRLEDYLNHPSESTVLIIVAPYEKLDRRKKIVKRLEKTAAVYELSHLSDTALFQLLEQVAQKYGAHYTREGHEQMMNAVGPHLGQLANEVGKCALYCGTERPIDAQAVEEIGSKSLETNVFLLVNQVMHQKTAEALELFHELVRMKEEPLKLLALLERQFRIVYQAGRYQEAGYTQNSIASKMSVHPYAVKLALQQTRAFSPVLLQHALKRCTETDFQIKTGQMDKILALELLIISISGKAA
ncbi:DNA polymerase III subunit delta [Sporolactobacillus terrae]|uniref:DNA polymerase III subunit delta n=1 Tax=Sporolactobacillus terrae TaxID=269673 RepID=A0A410D9Q0_9BACL|nr:DNA polymerase III subunit delta [Sporolactobacillus terrae]QAA22851.1 DNA polymerase III subunit delta [Sporolactobacillus terrae]QAA25825.1 DNA polymerase III subunit delta [Sporolactobacillus terrae]UAK17701.1 DNA polymerase III subunit delta [Sporolactobacillus terrae]BBN99249.1 DNA polymerase III subunit delta [Sporolactobacillus terrae]